MNLKIVKYPEPVLSQPGEPVNEFNDELRKFVADMFETMYAAQGIGLAAPQVAVSKRVTVIDLSMGKVPAQKLVLINPEVIFREGKQYEEEGCLSFPGLYGKVRRAKWIRAQAYNLKGELEEVSATDLEARVWQHEVDHLHGDLFIDKMGPIAKLGVRSEVKKFEHDYRRAQERGEMPPDLEIEKRLDELERLA